jgi:hypothetical protein
MTSRTHVVRTDDQGGIATNRSLGNCTLFCSYEEDGSLYGGDSGNTVDIGSIAVSVSTDFGRWFVAATVAQVTVEGSEGRMVVELYCRQLSEIISSVTVPSGRPVALTGVIDLPAGEHEICIRMYSDNGAYGNWSGASLQVIAGQTVGERGCILPPPVPTGFSVKFFGTSYGAQSAMWEDVLASGYTTLTLTGITADLDFHPEDCALATAWYGDVDVDSGGMWGEGYYNTSPGALLTREEIRNLHGPVLLDQTQFGPYGGFRDASDPLYRPIEDFAEEPFLALAFGPVVLTVDEYTYIGAYIEPDTYNIPGYIGDAFNPDVWWSGSVTFQFAEAGDDIVIEME